MLPDIIPVILAGGPGRRLWPFARKNLPKPFVTFRGQSLLRMTAARMQGGPPPVIVAGRAYGERVASGLRDCPPRQIFLEPAGRGTAPAAAAVAHYFRGSGGDPLLLVMPCDHLIRRPEALRAAVAEAVPHARQGAVVMFGVAPRHPATAYGYIRRAAGTNDVAQFVEKPGRDAARRFVREGWLWNSGIFLFSASVLLARLRAADPQLHDASLRAVARATRRQNAVLLDEASFAACPAGSLDRAVMEKEGARAVIPVDMGWRDLGNPVSFLGGLLGV